MLKTTIVIPARYGSTRFPGKPLALLNGKTVLERVIHIAREAAEKMGNSSVLVATEDPRILEHALKNKTQAILTSEHCRTGTDRVYEALKKLPLSERPDLAINLQGDTPLVDPRYLQTLIQGFRDNASLNMATLCVRLSWQALDRLRQAKEDTPFSGTTVTLSPQGKAYWFSKQIIPAIRKEIRKEPLSPVRKHIGIYGYRWLFLEQFVHWPEGYFEALEGLEQLRVLEQGESIHVLEVEGSGDEIGIDSPEDLKRAEALLSAP